jgi:uracil-DNA glycosylase
MLLKHRTKDLKEFFKPSHLSHLRSLPPDEIWEADPVVLKEIKSRQAKQQRAKGIVTIRDLILADLPLIPINPNLLCLLQKRPLYDPGPPCSWERRFEQAPLAFYQAHPANRFRTDFGPVYYRGRLNGSTKILIVGQDPSTDEILVQRAFVGLSGQRVQGILKKIGITRSYVMFNAFLFGIFQQFDAQMQGISLEPDILNYRNSLFDKVKAESSLQLIISFGNGADHAIQHWPGRAGITWLELTHPAADDNFVSTNWNANLAALHAAVTPDDAALVDLSAYPVDMAGAAADIPRQDLPFGVPTWHGAQGNTRSQRDGNKIIKWRAP